MDLLLVDVVGIDDPAGMVLVVHYNFYCYIANLCYYNVVLVVYKLVEESLDTVVLGDRMVGVVDAGSCPDFDTLHQRCVLRCLVIVSKQMQASMNNQVANVVFQGL